MLSIQKTKFPISGPAFCPADGILSNKLLTTVDKMELMIISSPTCFSGELPLINQLFEAGLKVFHLRKEPMSKTECQHFMKEIDEVYHERIALHQHHELIADFNLKRIHYTEQLRKTETPDYGSNLIKSTSIHDMKDLIHLSDFNYTFFSPVFDSLSKPGYKGMAKTGFEIKKGASKIKVIALGGINTSNVNQIKEMKFDGAGLLGCIWNDPAHALQTFKNIQAKCIMEQSLEKNQND